MSLANNLLGKV